MKTPENIQELRKEFKTIKSVVCGDTRFGAQALLFIAERLNDLTTMAKQRPGRPPSEWQKFFGAGIKAGKAPRQIAQEWKAKKAAA